MKVWMMKKSDHFVQKEKDHLGHWQIQAPLGGAFLAGKILAAMALRGRNRGLARLTYIATDEGKLLSTTKCGRLLDVVDM